MSKQTWAVVGTKADGVKEEIGRGPMADACDLMDRAEATGGYVRCKLVKVEGIDAVLLNAGLAL